MDGLTYTSNIVTEEEATVLLDFINSQEWQQTLQRKVQQYGPIYDYKTKTLVPAKNDIPLVFKNFMNKNNLSEMNQVIVNAYEVGEGISAHTDHVRLFGGKIASLSLMSDIEMEFQKNGEKIKIWLEKNSLVVLEGIARYEWTHCIVARKSDLINGKRVNRRKRISITFRRTI